MAKHFEAAETAPIRPLVTVRGGRIDAVGGSGSIVVGVERTFIGRAAQCALVLDDASVSALHAEVRATPDGVHFVDLGSRNGSSIGGNRVVEAYLVAPTEIACGRRRLRFTPEESVDAELPAAVVTQFGRLVSTTRAMQVSMEKLRKVAASDMPLLITGETGTGKEVAARAVHEASARRAKPFVAINCAAVPDHLLEDELFGHVRGAFTNAERDRPGRFVEADGGTLFFDELGEMGAAMQGKLLRVLQEQVVSPLGGSARGRRVNVRILSATNANLEEMVNRGTFRQDLYFRLCNIAVDLPPLRERLEDLPLLVRQLLGELGRPDVAVSAETLRELQAREWRGNVRELRFMLEVSLLDAADHVLSLDDRFAGKQGLVRTARGDRRALATPLESLMETMTLAEYEREGKRRFITRLYGRCRGNVSQMSRLGGMRREKVREALQEAGLVAKDDRDD